MRGEQLTINADENGNTGSPPLARGTVVLSAALYRRRRITPACAGNRRRCANAAAAGQDHPRLRGEQYRIRPELRSVEGSPPLARGTVVAVCIARPAAGITPACAGNSTRRMTKTRIYRDHPRLRGEQAAAIRTEFFYKGSPPLARGTESFPSPCALRRRITPACAGNSLSAPMKSLGAEDHPRLRGEQDSAAAIMRTALGSPPLARGTDHEFDATYQKLGITPACAGNRSRRAVRDKCRGDHPRLRGEQGAWRMDPGDLVGSPPLARGTD